jgi:DNA-directed RNA polymerase specialized sigma24 family protein
MSSQFSHAKLAAARTVSVKDATLQQVEICERLRIALRDLQPEVKEVFFLRQNSRLSYEEMARLRRCPVEAVKTLMRMALRDLRNALNES